VQQPIADAAPCERARAGWRDGAADVQSRLTALGRCLERMSYDCARERAALTPALDALAEFERRIGEACR
jgi:hypothetical protein